MLFTDSFFVPSPRNRLQGSVLSSGAAMDDSSMFMEWAMETLQHEYPAADAYAVDDDPFPTLQDLHCPELQNGTAPAAPDGHRLLATDSWSSGDSGRENTPRGAVVENDGGSSNRSVGSTTYPPVGWNLTSTMPQPSIHDEITPTAHSPAHDVPLPAQRPPASRKRSLKSAASTETGQTSSPEPCVQEHVMAERKRREKINRRFIELSTVIPGLKKMDKATILCDAVRYVKEQQEKLKELEDRNVRSVDSVVLVKRPCIATKSDGTATNGNSLPEIEARISESTVMVKIHCEDGKGVLVKLLAEVEGLHLSITHTNVIPFPSCTVNITIMAKVEEGFNNAPEEIVSKLHAALH
ncbi:transcription factor bHLH18-like [Lolium rigidum]|uniref:transcription factor bHLH18-like n=1 Tax=Lolium rigidum TaxID=89674 RepID=UPI001F5D796B|nr:transcription factor bHLH18-like [Lolium rigidum]